ncbi:alpha/beta fold hydrolase [Rhizobium glycinendophyticum]|uniref:Alpha/beta hydrolase n=1 Tax=Rhizobium glycinendophyticum TaxID=2589807 RepID=A0A504UNB7_9HYPH|nr:alpha/beta hydrolase [Rhizobium glycinendophyticum]TPP10506.1 alpha/beta hydrolase [Rhizobium glycinendophyticum]
MTAYHDHFIRVPDGLCLHVREYGAGKSGIPVVCLPGLTRNLLDFEDLALILAAGPSLRRVLSISSRGRGLSDRDSDPTRYTIPVEAADVVAVLDHLGIEQAAFIGTSRGGLILHVLAMTHLPRIERVVLNDIGPVLELEGLQQIQAYLGGRSAPESFAVAAALLRAVHGEEFPALADEDWRGMARALFREANSRVEADYDAEIARQFRAADLSQPFPTLWAQFDLLAETPLMVIRGENSRLLSRETVDEMQHRKPDLVAIEAEGQGHAPLLHLATLPEAIRVFLQA